MEKMRIVEGEFFHFNCQSIIRRLIWYQFFGDWGRLSLKWLSTKRQRKGTHLIKRERKEKEEESHCYKRKSAFWKVGKKSKKKEKELRQKRKQWNDSPGKKEDLLGGRKERSETKQRLIETRRKRKMCVANNRGGLLSFYPTLSWRTFVIGKRTFHFHFVSFCWLFQSIFIITQICKI